MLLSLCDLNVFTISSSLCFGEDLFLREYTYLDLDIPLISLILQCHLFTRYPARCERQYERYKRLLERYQRERELRQRERRQRQRERRRYKKLSKKVRHLERRLTTLSARVLAY
jgi:predicted ribosome quality control (RQC) complex YloA/Tae2 family protein